METVHTTWYIYQTEESKLTADLAYNFILQRINTKSSKMVQLVGHTSVAYNVTVVIKFGSYDLRLH